MTKEIAIEIIRIYEEEKKEVEKDKTSKFWSNPESTAGYYSNYKVVADGEECSLTLTGIDGHPP